MRNFNIKGDISMAGERPFFLNLRPSVQSNGSPLQTLLCKIYPGVSKSRIEQSEKSMRIWLKTEEGAVEHIKMLEKAGWSNAMIKQTIGATTSPVRHVHAITILALQSVLEDFGIAKETGRDLVLQSKAIHSAGGPEALKEKLQIIVGDCGVNVLLVFLHKYGAAIALALPAEQLRAIVNVLRSQGYTQTQIATSRLITHIRSKAFKASQLTVSEMAS